MKIKIGNTIFDAEKEPIMLILTDKDKENIKNMLPECTKFCAFPNNTEIENIQEFMKD